MTKAKILVVEDEVIVALDIQRTLERFGYHVSSTASSGEEALQKIEELKPDLVLMDIVLAGHKDGIETAEEIRSRFKIPVVYLTAYTDDVILQRAKRTEPFGYILKPFGDRDLNTAVEIALYKHNMEEKLKESQQWLSTTLNSIGDAVIATDREGRVTLINPVAQSLTGWNFNDAAGKDLKEVFHIINEETRQLAENPVSRVLREGIVIGLANHTALLSKDGTEIPIADSGAPIKDEKGNILGVVMVFRDITERKRAEELIQRTLERFRALLEIDQAISSSLELRTVLHLLLEKIDLVLPYSATTLRLMNKEIGLLEPVACRNLPEEEWKAEKWKGGRGPANLVYETKAPLIVRNVQTDLQIRDPEFFQTQGLVSYLGVPLIVKGEFLGVLSFYTKQEHEFTSEETEFLSALAGQAAIAIVNSQLYERTKKQTVELERANKVKDEFLSVMSHELRTPLNVCAGYAAILKDKILGEINPEQERTLEKIINSSRDLLSMITGILSVTALESKVMKAVRYDVKLVDLLEELKSTYAIPSHKELAPIWDYPPELPTMKTDGEKLKQILQNLINNAVKFTAKGSVTISVRYLSHREAVEFKVADTGLGIAREDLSAIFEKFRQLDSSETRSHGGVGLGLYIVNFFTKLMGGELGVESELGKGSIFIVTLPVDIQETGPVA